MSLATEQVREQEGKLEVLRPSVLAGGLEREEEEEEEEKKGAC